MTANLDGETNLKTQSAPNETRGFTQPHLLNNLRAQVKIKSGIREKSGLNIFCPQSAGSRKYNHVFSGTRYSM